MTEEKPTIEEQAKLRKAGRDALDRPLVKRFFQTVTVETVSVAATDSCDGDGANISYGIRLDGKTVRTPARAELCVSSQALAKRLCAEWEAQGEFINPQSMPLTQLANTAIDGVRIQMDEVVASTLAFAGSDLLCYRAEGPESLVELQSQHWDPVLEWVAATFGAKFQTSAGIMHVAQLDENISRIEAHLKTFDPLALSAVNVMTSLCGSVFLALTVAENHFSAAEAWQAAHIDEEWQMSRWGGDAEAELRRETRFKDMQAAADFLHLSRSE